MRRIVLALALLATGLLSAPAEAAGPITVRVSIEWSMEPRFGMDADRDGRIDLPNTVAYVQGRVGSGCDPCPEPRHAVTLRGAVAGDAVPVRSWTWIISGGGLPEPLVYPRLDGDLVALLPEGRFQVEARAIVAIPWGTVTLAGRETIAVDDILVVAIGDSYASGEGNPEVRRIGSTAATWADGGDAFATQAHERAHRSTVSWPARVALALERASERSSVTFVSLAGSGARIDRGILSPQDEHTPAQLDEVTRLVGGRQIDLLLVQAGGNSVGFSHVVRALVDADPQFDPVCYHLMVEQAFASVADGDWSRDVGVHFSLPFRWSCRPTRGQGPQLPGLAGLPAAFSRLAAAIESLSVARTVLVSYPDPTGAGPDGSRCREIVGDTTDPVRFHEVSEAEGSAAVDRVLAPLNAHLAQASLLHGWDFVGGISEAFAAGHGYCAAWPNYGYEADEDRFPGFAAAILDQPDGWYRNPGDSDMDDTGDLTWYRTATQSAVLQGPAAPYATSGTLHPNEIGHAAIARMVLARIGD